MDSSHAEPAKLDAILVYNDKSPFTWSMLLLPRRMCQRGLPICRPEEANCLSVLPFTFSLRGKLTLLTTAETLNQEEVVANRNARCHGFWCYKVRN